MIIMIGWFLIILVLLRLGVSFINFVTFMYLPDTPGLKSKPKVSVLIPVRNEEKNIRNILSDLSAFRYQPLEIIICDDNSTDQTPRIIEQSAANHPNIKFISGKPLPGGWLGKNFSCHILAGIAQGDFFLFMDADDRVKNGLIERSVSFMDRHGLDLLSIFPEQITGTRESRFVVPIMNWILLSLLPLILIRASGHSSLAAANGQFMMFRKSSYKQIWPHKLFRNNKAEDIETSRYFKKKGMKVSTLLGNEFIRCRMYDRLEEAIEGFARNVFTYFGNSMPATILFGLLTTLAPVYIFIFMGTAETILYLLAIVLIRIFVSLASRQPVFLNLLYMIPQHYFFLRVILRAVVGHQKKKLIWKDRNILS